MSHSVLGLATTISLPSSLMWDGHFKHTVRETLPGNTVWDLVLNPGFLRLSGHGPKKNKIKGHEVCLAGTGADLGQEKVAITRPVAHREEPFLSLRQRNQTQEEGRSHRFVREVKDLPNFHWELKKGCNFFP